MPRERRSESVRVRFMQACTVTLDDRSRSFDSFVINVNTVGAYIAADKPPDVCTWLRVRFRVPGTERDLHLHAIVMWTNEHKGHPVNDPPVGFGVQFVGLTLEERALIRAFMDAAGGSRTRAAPGLG